MDTGETRHARLSCMRAASRRCVPDRRVEGEEGRREGREGEEGPGVGEELGLQRAVGATAAREKSLRLQTAAGRERTLCHPTAPAPAAPSPRPAHPVPPLNMTSTAPRATQAPAARRAPNPTTTTPQTRWAASAAPLRGTSAGRRRRAWVLPQRRRWRMRASAGRAGPRGCARLGRGAVGWPR